MLLNADWRDCTNYKDQKSSVLGLLQPQNPEQLRSHVATYVLKHVQIWRLVDLTLLPF